MIDTGDTKLLIDPSITGNPTATVTQEDYILVSHGHEDHLGDTVDIAKRTGAMVISNYEIHNWLIGQDPDAWASRTEQETSAKVLVLNPEVQFEL